ncbi:MAG: phenylalanine--tRNA ligase subunit alpha [Cystobacterineae bacterium]|nr:phenylalanine--tRNA ligase subunit alpha [Cystobacterineae bacterium]
MQNYFQTLLEQAKQEIGEVEEISSTQLEALRVKYLGKKGALSQGLAQMGKLAAEARKQVGAVANQVKAEVEALLTSAMERAEELALEASLRVPKVDISLPGRLRPQGHCHPVSQTMDDIVDIFIGMGFEVADGPEVELDWYNFEALNFLENHPARDMQDSFYVHPEGFAEDARPMVLRTHTSPVQVRTMQAQPPPLRAIMPGRVYRRDFDITHTPMFHQVEGLFVDANVSMADLKGTLNAFLRAFFGQEVKTRFRASYFPFTEPSAEVDISCVICKGAGCRVCKMSGWLEILGAGMVHPNVLLASGYNPQEVTGFAFGMGVERTAMLRYGIGDLRSLFENDIRFLARF